VKDYSSNNFSTVLINIEIEYYEITSLFKSLSEQTYSNNPAQKSTFWDEATKYTSSTNEDKSFVNEIAYMMVTLHRTGA
jgi:hypothetical protein